LVRTKNVEEKIEKKNLGNKFQGKKKMKECLEEEEERILLEITKVFFFLS